MSILSRKAFNCRGQVLGDTGRPAGRVRGSRPGALRSWAHPALETQRPSNCCRGCRCPRVAGAEALVHGCLLGLCRGAWLVNPGSHAVQPGARAFLLWRAKAQSAVSAAAGWRSSERCCRDRASPLGRAPHTGVPRREARFSDGRVDRPASRTKRCRRRHPQEQP